MELKKICVIGTGLMGSGIAQICAQAGFEVLLTGRSSFSLERAMDTITKNLSKDVDREKIKKKEMQGFLSKITATTDLGRAADQADVIIEAIVENMAEKKELFREIAEIAPPACLFFSNTSGLSITELASATGNPERFAGTHFFYPVPHMPLMEIIRGYETSDATIETAKNFGQKLGKEITVIKDSPAFTTSRILSIMLNEAFFVLGEGIASAKDIDKGMALGCHHPMGPLALADLVGLDTLLNVMEDLYQELGDKYRPAPLLKKLVRAGHCGKKAGKGVYDYTIKYPPDINSCTSGIPI